MPSDFHGALVDSVVHVGHVFVVMMLDFDVDGSRHGHPGVVNAIPNLHQEVLLYLQPSAPRNSHFAFVHLIDYQSTSRLTGSGR